MQRFHAPTGAWKLAFSHLDKLALVGALWLLFLAVWVQPSHLAQEVHALLPASSEHHVAIHCEGERERAPRCEKPDDDVSKPLNGPQHERHHEAECAADSQFLSSSLEPVNIAPPAWDVVTLDFVSVSPAPRFSVPASPRKSRAPPPDEAAPQPPTLSSQSGRAPPLGA